MAGWRILMAAIIFACLPTIGIFSGGSYAALVIGLAAILLIAELAAKRWPDVDGTLAGFAGLFLLLIWLGLAWSIAPARTLSGDLQMTGLFVAGLVLLGLRRTLTIGADTIFHVALLAAIVGPLLMCFDGAIGHPILTALEGPKPGGDYYAKLSRGLGQLAIVIWPIIAFGWLNGRRRLAAAATVIFAGLLIWQIEHNVSVTLCFALGLIAWGFGRVAPRSVAGALAAMVSVVAIGVPFVVQIAARPLFEFADRIKPSARHRLEIWDYITARVLERPIAGWGWQTSQFLPITAEERAHSKYLGADGIPHPHDFWIQFWVETGGIGLLLGLAFTLIVLRRIWRLPQDVRPFGLAAFTTAFVMSLPSFNLATDSWWCALFATGLLFALLPSARQRLAQ